MPYLYVVIIAVAIGTILYLVVRHHYPRGRWGFGYWPLMVIAGCASKGSSICADGHTEMCGAPDAGTYIVKCFDLMSDTMNCGACGVACMGKNSQGVADACVSGSCAHVPCQPRKCHSSDPPYCGMLPDDCGGLVDCGGCPAGSTCGVGAENYCGVDGCPKAGEACGGSSACCGGPVGCAGQGCGGNGCCVCDYGSVNDAGVCPGVQ